MINLIVCVDSKNGIGFNGTIPWNLPPDMEYFREKTTNNIIVMGRKTWESIGSKALPNRINIVITSNPENIKGAFAFTNLKEIITIIQQLKKSIFVIGGSKLYEEAIPFADFIYLTRIDKDFNCDTFFPHKMLNEHICSTSPWIKYNDLSYRYELYYK